MRGKVEALALFCPYMPVIESGLAVCRLNAIDKVAGGLMKIGWMWEAFLDETVAITGNSLKPALVGGSACVNECFFVKLVESGGTHCL